MIRTIGDDCRDDNTRELYQIMITEHKRDNTRDNVVIYDGDD